MTAKRKVEKAVAPSTGTTPQGQFAEIGIAGLRVTTGYVWEEFLPQLRSDQGRRIYQEMAANDATVGAVLHAIGLLIRAVKWDATPVDDSSEAADEAEFALSLFDDMSHSFEDFIAECLTMLIFGWSYFEIVLKRRGGPTETSPESRFTDGRIGIRKLAPRAQDTLQRWEMQDDGGISGMWQQPPMGGGVRFLPIERCLLFRTVSRKNNPEGISILRSAYVSWHALKYIEQYEQIGIERELAGLPVVAIPQEVLASKNPDNIAIRNQYEKAARDIKFNEQGGLVIPSDTFQNQDGSLSAIPKVSIKLLTSGGQRAINTDVVIQRKQRGIARSCLADFIMLGEGSGTARGSYGMHEGKADLFLRACETILRQIAYPLNRYLLPRLWALNGIDPELMPELKPGRMQKSDLTEIGTYIRDLSTAGMPLFPDDKLEAHLRDEADLPEKSPEAQAAQEEQAQIDQEMARQGLAATEASQQPKAVVKYNPDQPRDPAGTSTGGQWSKGNIAGDWYHGTSGDFESFRLPEGMKAKDEPVIFATDDEEHATEFARMSASARGGEGQIFPVKIKDEDVARFRWKDYADDPIYDPAVMAKILKEAKERNVKVALIRGVQSFEGSSKATYAAIFDPASIRRANGQSD